MNTGTTRKRMIDRSKAAREGRRMYAFYQGVMARRRGQGTNPFEPGGEEHTCWSNGWKYAAQDDPCPLHAVPPVCRFGPGGDYVRDWPMEGAP